MYVATQSDGSRDVSKSNSMAPLVKLPGNRLFLRDLHFGVGRWGDLGYRLIGNSHGSSRPFRLEPPLLPSFTDFCCHMRGGVSILCGAEPLVHP